MRWVVVMLVAVVVLAGCGEPDISPAINTLMPYCTDGPYQLRADAADAQQKLLAGGVQATQLAVLHEVLRITDSTRKVSCAPYFNLAVAHLLLKPAP